MSSSSAGILLALGKLLASVTFASILLGALVPANGNQCGPPCVPGDEEIMSPKEHGTSSVPVMKKLRWKCSWKEADRICNYNRHYVENSGYWETTTFLHETKDARSKGQPIEFYDSNTGRLLFTAPVGRSWNAFIAESKNHGWPSFRDEEVRK